MRFQAVGLVAMALTMNVLLAASARADAAAAGVNREVEGEGD